MDDTGSARTSPTLLGRLRQQPSDQAAWEQFVARYGRLILAWCRRARLQDADIEDVSQIVLIKLADWHALLPTKREAQTGQQHTRCKTAIGETSADLLWRRPQSEMLALPVPQPEPRRHGERTE